MTGKYLMLYVQYLNHSILQHHAYRVVINDPLISSMLWTILTCRWLSRTKAHLHDHFQVCLVKFSLSNIYIRVNLFEADSIELAEHVIAFISND